MSAHMRTCICTPTLTFAKRQANGSLTKTKFQRNPSSRFRDTEKGHISRAHVQMYSTYDLSNMYRGLVSKHTPNFVTIGLFIPEL